MKRMMLLVIVFSLTVCAFASDEFKVPPEEYRSWHHVKTMVIFDTKHPLYNPFNGIHNVYVNDKGLETIKKSGKRTFPDGTVIAIVFYEHKESNGAFVEGKKRIEAFMVKNSKEYRKTNGWGYYGYDGKGNPLVKDMAADCHGCHAQVSGSDFVFSVWKK
ncbi:MAG: cytochrome C [Nitrospirae bacterium]|nr:MAG: cytochrome C [Nitrospirota bacterium]